MSKPVALYECIGCGHMYMAPVSRCDCMENPENLYREWVATRKQVKVPQCPSCGGSNAPCDQVDCETVPCMVGRPYTRDADPVKH